MIFQVLRRKICKQLFLCIAVPSKMAQAIFVKFYIWESFNQTRGKCQFFFFFNLNNYVILHKALHAFLGHIYCHSQNNNRHTKNMSNISWNYLYSLRLVVSEIIKQKATSVTEFVYCMRICHLVLFCSGCALHVCIYMCYVSFFSQKKWSVERDEELHENRLDLPVSEGKRAPIELPEK
jgi:hypothetical protein